MDNNINYNIYNTYNININTNNGYIKDNIENIIIDYNKIKDIFNIISNIDIKYYKYLIPSYFIQTNVKNEDIYTTNLKKIIIGSTTYNILKNKFIIWPKHYYIFRTYSLLYNILNKCKNFLLITSNLSFIETIKYYNVNSNITHLEYDSKYKNFNKQGKVPRIWEDINLIKKKYKFKNYNLESDIDKIINDEKMYDVFGFDLVYISQYIEEFQDKEKFINTEKENLFLLNSVYKLLEKLKEGGIMLLIITTMICKETLLLLQSFALCFEKCKIFKFEQIYTFFKFPVFVFINYKKKVKSLTQITTDFYNCIKDYYESQLDILNDTIQKYNLIIKNKDNAEFLLSLEYQNLTYSYKIAKFLKLDTYNILDTADKDDKKDKIINIDTNIEKIFIVSLKNLVLIDTNNIFTISNLESQNIIFDKIIQNKVSKNNFKHFFEKITNNLEDLYRRPANTIDLVIDFLYLNDNILKKNLLLYDINVIDNLVSRKWILYYELLYNTKIFNQDDATINIFIYGENVMTLANVINYFNTRWNKNTKINFKLGSLLPNTNNIDKYHKIYSKYNNKWFCGDITKNKDIKNYQKICLSMDWIIIDCTAENYYNKDNNEKNDNDENENILGFKKILFVLNNLKKDGDCIINLSLKNQSKLLIDMMYLLYNNFFFLKFYIENTDVSCNIYIICKKYKKILTPKQIDTLFKINEDNTSSFISEYDDDFTTDYTNMLSYLSSIYINNIDNIKYYIDFWHVIKDENKVDLMNIINNKNHIWIKKYIKKN
jgi:hypothetical protein